MIVAMLLQSSVYIACIHADVFNYYTVTVIDVTKKQAKGICFVPLRILSMASAT